MCVNDKIKLKGILVILHYMYIRVILRVKFYLHICNTKRAKVEIDRVNNECFENLGWRTGRVLRYMHRVSTGCLDDSLNTYQCRCTAIYRTGCDVYLSRACLRHAVFCAVTMLCVYDVQ